ncbi:MAG: type IV toxin-antitoxin system AbiEi family antitoxin domain-containing protein [Actinomycetota bacterium]|nr:type IV toxin-antitoxin system AbiEi family antitoxin domain-containing protein [Actinomycetota bacterium]
MSVAARSVLRRHAAEHHGVFTTADAAAAGVSRRSLVSMCAAGEIERVHTAVYRYAGVPLTPVAQVAAAVRAGGPGTVASHGTALLLHGIAPVGAAHGIEVCSPTRWRPEVPGIVVHQTRRLDPCDVTSLDGVPVTSGARTVVDHAGRVDRSTLTTLVDVAVSERLCSRRWLYRRAAELRNGRAGVGIIMRLTHPGAEGEFRSWLERRGASAFRRFGVPPPQWNVALSDDHGYIGIVDAYWAWARLVVELEGLRFHTTPGQRRTDARRANRITRSYRLLRYTWDDVVHRPAEMAGEIRDALGGDVARAPIR